MNKIYVHELDLKSADILNKLKVDFHLVFEETLEKYIFLRLEREPLLSLLENSAFTVKDHYDIIKALIVWTNYDLSNRIHEVEVLFNAVEYRLCDKRSILQHKRVNTGDSVLDSLVRNLHVRICIHKDRAIEELLRCCDTDSIEISTKPRQVDEDKAASNTKSYLYRVDEDSIFNITSSEEVIRYAFGEVGKVIYIDKYIFIINFVQCAMYKFDTISRHLIFCSYPADYVFNINSPPTVNLTAKGDIITIGGWNRGPTPIW